MLFRSPNCCCSGASIGRTVGLFHQVTLVTSRTDTVPSGQVLPVYQYSTLPTVVFGNSPVFHGVSEGELPSDMSPEIVTG